MRKLKMMSSLLMAMTMVAVLYSCNSEEGTEPALDDTDLIAAIESAVNKVDVSTNALPGSANSVLEADFSESFVSNAKLAPELGYEVELRLGQGAEVGEASVAYFDLNGRELTANARFGQGFNGERRRIGRRARGIRDCFDFVFPVSLIMPDNSLIDLDSAGDWTLVRDWYQANPDADSRPSFVFPLEITFGEETITINSQEEFREAKSACEVDRRRGRCFDLVFPITFTMPDQSEITLASKEDWELIDAWYEENPDADERPDLNFPVDIQYPNDSIVTINSRDELQMAKAVCEVNRRIHACFDLVFPITFVMPDESQITLESREDWMEIFQWYRANPDADERPDLVFPIEITYDDGSTVTINDKQELRRAKADCG